MYRSDRRLYVNSDRTAVVPEGSPEAAFLLVGEGGEVDDAEAKRLGLLDSHGRKQPLGEPETEPDEPVVPEEKAEEPSANKERKPAPGNK